MFCEIELKSENGTLLLICFMIPRFLTELQGCKFNVQPCTFSKISQIFEEGSGSTVLFFQLWRLDITI